MTLNSFAKQLGKIPTLIFVGLYVLAILIFAIIYYNLPEKSFYHSTSKFEYSYLNLEANEIIEEIKTDVLNNLLEEQNLYTIEKDSFLLDYDNLELHSFNIINYPNEISFQITAPIYQMIDTNLIQQISKPIIIMNLKNKSMVNNNVFCNVKIEGNLNFKIPGLKTIDYLQVLFPTSKNKLGGNIPQRIGISVDTYSKIIYFGNAYKGFPDKVKGHWWRCFYLSVGISSSTVFGDIVPIKNISRVLVAIQAILSILIISLFFNALAQDISNSLSNPDEVIDDDSNLNKKLEDQL